MSSQHQAVGLRYVNLEPGQPHFIPPRPANITQQVQASSLSSDLSLKGLPVDVLLILGYVVLSRSFLGNEAGLGIKIGPVPLFVTDALLMSLVAINLHKRS